MGSLSLPLMFAPCLITPRLNDISHPFEDGLKQDWHNDTCWMNPPYGRGQDVYAWVKKAYDTAQMGGTVVCLLPASTDVRWFHDIALKSTEIRFVKDRLWFGRNGTAARANHASMVVVFKQYCGNGKPIFTTMDNFRKRSRP